MSARAWTRRARLLGGRTGLALALALGVFAAPPAQAGEPADADRTTSEAEKTAAATLKDLQALCADLARPDRRIKARRTLARKSDWVIDGVTAHYDALKPRERRVFMAEGAELGGAAAKRLVRTAWLREEDAEVIRAAAQLAARVGEPVVLRELLTSPKERDRLVAVRGLARVDGAVEPLAGRLTRDESDRVRIAAARALGLKRNEGAARALLRAAADDPAPEVRTESVRALRRVLAHVGAESLRDAAFELVRLDLVSTEVAPVLPDLLHGLELYQAEELLRHPLPKLRALGFAALALSFDSMPDYERTRAGSLIVGGLTDDVPQVQAAAIRAARQVGLEEAVPHLVERLRRHGDPLQAEVVRALQVISGEEYGASFEAWQRWAESRAGG